MEGLGSEDISTKGRVHVHVHGAGNKQNELSRQGFGDRGVGGSNGNDGDNDKFATLTQEVNYLRQVVDFQNIKIDKLTALITEYFENKNEDVIIRSLQAIQDNVIEDDHVNEMDNQVDQQVGVHGELGSQPVHLDGNMDPALHQVAVVAAAVQAQEAGQQQQEQQQHQHQLQHQHQQQQQQQHQQQHQQQQQRQGARKPKKIYAVKRKHDGTGPQDDEDEVNDGYAGRADAKKPKIQVDFLHNPMSVKEIYDEFTKGFRGQLPLREMDAKYGKHEWRGDSRSKESKRFQRRKKLFDAIERGVIKYGKPVEEIINYIEQFRGDKSLTWVMNGHLPPDLMN